MQFIYQEATDSGVQTVEAGLLWLRPRASADQDRRDLALYALEHGADGFLIGATPIEKIVLPLQPTLDDVLAGQIIARGLRGDSLPEGLRAFAQYARTVRQGLQAGTVPLDASLEGIYWAARSLAGADLSAAAKASQFSLNSSRLMDHIVQAAKAGLDPHCDRLFDDAEFSLERGLLADDKKVYRQDVSRGKSWVAQIPDGPPQAAALMLNRPRSALFKHWCRHDEEAPGGDGYTLLAINHGDGNWVVTTPRSSRLSLKQLADTLQQAETELEADTAGTDPWYDGHAFDHTLVAAPKRGTQLSDAQVLQIIQNWAPVPRNWALPTHRVWAAASVVAVAVAAGFLLAGWPDRNSRSGPQPIDHGARVATSATSNTTSRGRPLPYVRDGVVEKGIHLYGLNIGISDYEDDSYDLTYADNDAEAFLNARGEAGDD